MKIIISINILLYIILSSVLVTANEKSLPIKYKKAAADETRNLDESTSVNNVKANCGFHIPTFFDMNALITFEDKGASLSNHCDRLHLAIEAICVNDKDGSYKKAFKEKFKKIQCKLSSSVDEPKLKLNNGTLEFFIFPLTPNLIDFSTDWLKDNI